MKISRSNLRQTILLEFAIVDNEKNLNVLPFLLVSYKQLFPVLFSRKNFLFQETLEVQMLKIPL